MAVFLSFSKSVPPPRWVHSTSKSGGIRLIASAILSSCLSGITDEQLARRILSDSLLKGCNFLGQLPR
ncbi:MAG: hypothetical protein BWY70_01107 [Bacteroidetes bacterium ADurb.Bin408]|nr:MAG: hypothetical protein BWY70_01107 [Bacteroidetes bacterium ADurb.Bin408]